ncbi:MAG: hypothetical protein Q8Q03_03140 [bacterium]|nr:hypothetical protein [bacterium]
MANQLVQLLFDNKLQRENKIMGTKVLVGGSTVSAPQLQDFFRQIADGSINGYNLQRFLDHQDPFALEAVVIDWGRVYQSLEMENEFRADIGKIAIPSDPGFWDVCVIQGVTPNRVVKALRDLGLDMSLYTDDLDKGVPTNDRDPANGSYRVRFQKTIEADPELKDKSAETLTEENIKGITLLERLLLELRYFLATGNHLDNENVTLCSGSRSSFGDVPCVYWRRGRRGVCVYWYYPSDSHSGLRARAVVS